MLIIQSNSGNYKANGSIRKVKRHGCIPSLITRQEIFVKYCRESGPLRSGGGNVSVG